MSMMRVILHILFVIAVMAVVTISFELNRARISVDYGPRYVCMCDIRYKTLTLTLTQIT